MIIRSVIFLFLAILISSCATLETDHSNQKVPVNSDPMGAKVFLNGKEMGETPLILDIERGRKNKKLTLHLENHKRDLDLESRFRWLDSGLSNLMFLTAYPYALTTDFISGAAWQVDEEVNIAFPELAKKNQGQKVIIIAPPQGEKEYWAPEVAQNMERFVQKKYPDTRVIPLRMTYPLFYDWDYDYHQRPILKEQRALHKIFEKSLSATHIFETFYEIRGNRLHIYSELVSLPTAEPESQHNISIALSKIEKFRNSLWQKRAGTLFNFTPNNMALLASNSTAQLKLRDPSNPSDSGLIITGQDLSRDDILGQASQVLSAITINFLDPPTSRRASRYEFSFVPSIIFSLKRFQFTNSTLLEDYTFENLIIGGGYGPQWSLVSNWGKTFFELIPTVYYGDLRWKSSATSEQGLSNVVIGSQTRFGHTAFVNNHVNLTFFVQTTNENADTWQKSIDKITGTPSSVIVEDSSRVFAGFALGYYFPVFENPVGKIYE